jgi:hypothetical protein
MSHMQQAIAWLLDSQDKVQMLHRMRHLYVGGDHWRWQAAMFTHMESMVRARLCFALYQPANDPLFAPEAA